MEIKWAKWGGVDCTEIVKSKIRGNTLSLRADNSLIGDTMVGVVKYLEIEINGEIHKVREGDSFTYPKTETKKLGVWYSNDETNHPAVKKSLETIKIASEGKADIITCVWSPISGNPFNEIISWNRNSSHLNQLLQILQCLYTAKAYKEYDYVSFMEHDVMYPKGYFDYPTFDRGQVLTNMNYGGICTEGWQYRGQNDEPMHQMTMRFDDAFKHFHSILGNALHTNSGMIENQDFKRIQWECDNQSIHINHGKHFTSHFSIYRKNDCYNVHPYWGEHSDYLHLF